MCRSIRFFTIGVLLLLALVAWSGTDQPALAQGETPAVRYHLVQPGDTLSGVAYVYGVPLAQLMTLNSLSNPNFIFVGQLLRLPPISTIPGGATTHVVQPGESLLGIATFYQVPLTAIQALNQIPNPNYIQVGQHLVIPTTATSTPVEMVPAPAPIAKQIVVDLSEQRTRLYENGVLVYEFIVSTGEPGLETVTGSFTILNKLPMAYAYTWDLQMPYWLGVYWAGSLQNGFHALPIMPDGSQLWAGYLGTPISYGCIVLSQADAETLYAWAEVGTPVEIRE